MMESIAQAWHVIGEAVSLALKAYIGLAIFYPLAYLIKNKKLPPF